MYVKRFFLNIYIKEEGGLSGNAGENKKVLQKVDIAEALTRPGVPNGVHQHMVLQEVVLVRIILWSVLELLEYENNQTETK